MSSTSSSPGRTPVHIDGIAVRFALILCDRLTADTYYASCERDRITLRFPGEDISISLTQPAAGALTAVFTGTRHSPTGGRSRRTFRAITVPGLPGSAAQRAALLREIERLRAA